MNLRLDLHVLGWLLVALGVFLLIPVATALWLGEDVAAVAASASFSLLGGLLLARMTRRPDPRVRGRDGYLVVAVGWMVASLIGALPYIFAGVAGPVDAFFEAAAGFTTTGSTVLAGLDRMPRWLLLWRSLTQWIGGMGIILFTIALLPLLGIGGMQLFKAEVPGPVKDKIRPRLVETARQLWLIYVGFTGAECLLLMMAGMSLFDAACHSFTTMATGGFSTHDASIGGFDSPLIEWIITLFMLIAGINFVLHYRLLSGRVREVWADAELRYFLTVVGVAALAIAVVLFSTGDSAGDAIRHAAFQVASIVTTTGYASVDFERWPVALHLVLIILMILGGMSGSTGGGIKSLRALLTVRAFRASFGLVLHPRAIRTVKYGGRPVPEEVLSQIWAFLTAYFLISVSAALVVTLYGYDLVTSLSAALTAVGNVGPGFGEVGAMDNFAHFPALVKLLLSFCMIAGRLEVFTMLLLLSPQFWRR